MVLAGVRVVVLLDKVGEYVEEDGSVLDGKRAENERRNPDNCPQGKMKVCDHCGDVKAYECRKKLCKSAREKAPAEEPEQNTPGPPVF